MLRCTGGFEDMRLLLAMLLTALCVGPALPQTARTPPAQSYLGRWYIEDPAVCKGPAGDTEGLLVYGRKAVEGYEYACDIVRTRRTGPRTEISTRCRAEGRTYVDTESVEIADGLLKRTIRVEGKVRTGEYRRCP
jgi:hypothetical protein